MPAHSLRREARLVRATARADRALERGRLRSARVTRWRLAIFLTGLAATVIPYKLGWYHAGNGALAAFLALFLTVARYHSRLEHRLHRWRLWALIKRDRLARLRLDWHALPAHLPPPADGHPYAADLDLIGPRSLLHLLDTTISAAGRERLAASLLDQHERAFDAEAWLARQSLVRELARLPLFRDRLELVAALAGGEDGGVIDSRRILHLLDTPTGFPGALALLGVEAVLAATTLLLLLASALAGLPEYWMLSFGAYAAVYFLAAGRLAPVFGRALSLHLELARLGAVLRFLEHRTYAGQPRLRALLGVIAEDFPRPSGQIRALARLCHALSIRAHPLVHLAANALLPWDLFFAHRLERLRRQIRARLVLCLAALAELDAASTLATFAFLNPGAAWPVPEPEQANGQPPGIAARALGHPLIPAAKRVPNDLHLRGRGRVLLVTGSNMSGKSTFLRTVGLNVCLAQAGAPVCAESFTWSRARLFCCIRVDDSLDAGLSFFYAEVKRLKRLLDAACDPVRPPVLFLIDEIFKGTNNRERLLGSREYVRALAESRGFGLVTTHDLELTELEKEIPGAGNAHFQEAVEGAVLRFDYRLRPGPCPTTNALRIMALEGLPVPDL